MRDETLLRLSGWSAVAGGLLRAANAFTAGLISENVLQYFYFATDVLLIFGLMGIYLSARAQLGWFGLLGFLTAVIGFLMVRSADLFGGYQTAASIALVGTVALGLSLLRNRRAIVAPSLWILSLLFGLAASFGFNPYWTTAFAGVAFGGAFVAAGTSLFSGARRLPSA